MDRGEWQATIRGVTKSWTWLSDWHYLFMMSSSCSKLFLITWSHTLKINKVAFNTVNSESSSWLWRSGIASAEDFTLWRNWQLSTQVTSYRDQIRSVAQSCPTLCDPMNRSTPGLPVHHQLPEFTQTHVHRVSDAIQPSHPLSSPSPPAPNPSQHQGLFQWVNSSHQVAKVLELQR